MPSQRTLDVARRATEIYEADLRDGLEKEHLHLFVAIEPESREYFLGATLSEAIRGARQRFPDRISFALRIGHPSAVNIGVMSA